MKLPKWLQFRPADRVTVLDALAEIGVPKQAPRVSWKVLPKRPRIKSVEDWRKVHGQEKAS